MTTEENEPQMPFDPLLASIFAANAKQAEWTTNALLANRDREIAELREAYVQLWYDLDRANETVDSHKVEVILMKHGMRVSRAEEALNKPAN